MSSSRKNLKDQPAYFLSLHLENVRSFGEGQQISLTRGNDLPAQWTIILGNNGTGKTTILKSLVALSPSVEGRYGEVTVRPSLASNWKYNWQFMRYEGKERARFSCDIYYGRKLQEMQEGSIKRDFYVKASFAEAKSHAYSSSFSSGFGNAAPVLESDSGSQADLSGLICYAYGANRRPGQGSLSRSSGKELGAADSLFDDGAELVNAEEWFLQLDYSYQLSQNDERLGHYLERVKQAFLEVLPEVTGIRVTEKERYRQGLEFETPYGWVRISEMSLGYQTLIAWLVDLASRLFDRYPESENPLAEPAVVLVDEIDLHLHPEWQRQLVGFLSNTFPNTQFIVTAHSPLVVQAATDANVVLVQREHDQVMVRNDLESVKNWRVDQILTSELFGLESARSPETEQLLKERTDLLSKKDFSHHDQEKVEALDKQIGWLPVGDSPAEIKADTIIRELARKLGKEEML